MEERPTISTLKLRLLGAPQVELDGRVVEIQRRKVRAMLYYLCTEDDACPRDRLATLFWPESNRKRAHGSLRRHLSELRQVLGDGWLEVEQDAIRVASRPGLWVDLREFHQRLAAVRQHGHSDETVCSSCIRPLTEAMALYRDDFLAGFTLADSPAFDDWQLFQAEEARLACMRALDRLLEAHFQLGDDVVTMGQAISHARHRLKLDPLHEEAHRQLMRLYEANGQRSQALRQFDLCAKALRAELDLPPSSETEALYAKIQHDTWVRPPGDETPLSTAPRHNLPASTTPFIGRAEQLATLLTLCRDPNRRLITIVGPGGIGKTRLSLEVAAQLVDGNPDGVYFVRLAQSGTTGKAGGLIL